MSRSRIGVVAPLLLSAGMASEVRAEQYLNPERQLGRLQLEVKPPNPLVTTPVTVTVSDEFSSACYEVCDTSGSWLVLRHYSIDG